jgi:hypothetical protein
MKSAMVNLREAYSFGEADSHSSYQEIPYLSGNPKHPATRSALSYVSLFLTEYYKNSIFFSDYVYRIGSKGSSIQVFLPKSCNHFSFRMWVFHHPLMPPFYI